MHHFDYRSGVLHAESVNLAELASSVGTPFYCYSTATLTRHYRVFADAFADVHALICYAMKANSNQAVIKTLAALGAGADVVSEGELRRARIAGTTHEANATIARTMDAAASAWRCPASLRRWIVIWATFGCTFHAARARSCRSEKRNPSAPGGHGARHPDAARSAAHGG